jgi:hypothetical protein
MEQANTKSQRFVKGHTWGDIHLKKSEIEFTNGTSWFNIPYNYITNVHLPSKNEISLEFNAEDIGDVK